MRGTQGRAARGPRTADVKGRRAVVLGALVALTLLAGGPGMMGTAAAASSASPCPGADDNITGNDPIGTSLSLRCLINRERASHGLGSLFPMPELGRAARAHADDMVRNHYFGHASRDGFRVDTRAVRAGYVTRSEPWSLGENLAWGSYVTPKEVMDAWMASPGHRRVILTAKFRHLGIGVTPGAPDAKLRNYNGPIATIATVFGVRGAYTYRRFKRR